MKKLVAGVATAAALSLSFAGAAHATYGPTAPSAHQVKHDVKKAISHGKISAKKAKKLKREVLAAKKAGLITAAQAAKLIKQINHDTKGHHKH